MKEKRRYPLVLRAVSHYLSFFAIAAFIVTCCTMLFVSILSESLGLTLTEENLNTAAKLTFINVLALSLIFTVIDYVRRKLTVERPIRQLTAAAQQMIDGDFSVRIPPVNSLVADSRFNEIVDCFNHMAQELSGVETLRTDFVANVSHEMKTPLAVMQNYAKLLQAPGLDEGKRMEYARGVSDAAHRLSDMMTNILKLNRLENQQIYPQAEQYDLSEQLCRCLLQFESTWEEADIGIETDIEEGITVKADSELLSLVWNNLFSNAFKFTPAGGTVRVSLTADERHAWVSVADTGCGMSGTYFRQILSG